MWPAQLLDLFRVLVLPLLPCGGRKKTLAVFAHHRFITMFSSSPSLSHYVVVLPHSQCKTSPRHTDFFAHSEVYWRLALKTLCRCHHRPRFFLLVCFFFSSPQLLLYSNLSSLQLLISSPLLKFSLFASLLSSGHTWRFQVQLWAWLAWPHQQPEHKPLFFQVRGVTVVILRLLIESQPHQSWVVNINVSCLIFTIPPPGGLPQTEQPMRKSRLESVSNRLSCTFTVTIMQMSSQPGFHPCSFYFRCKTQPSLGEPWLFVYWSHVDHTSVCVLSVNVCRQTCFKRHPQNFH